MSAPVGSAGGEAARPSAASESDDAAGGSLSPAVLAPHPAATAAAARSPLGVALAPSRGAENESAGPRLIYTARITAVVDAASVAIDRVIAAAIDVGGYLSSRNDASVTVRVPSAQFRPALAALEHIGRVTHREVQAEDVSEQYRDLEVRLANLRAVRQRLQDFLARAASVADALAVEHELERVAQEIDQTEGRLRFLAQRVAYSSLTVSFVSPPTAVPVAQPVMPGFDTTLPVDWLEHTDLPSLLQLRGWSSAR